MSEGIAWTNRINQSKRLTEKMKMEIAKFMPRWMTKKIARLLKACMKFSPDHPHDRVLWVNLDIWLNDEDVQLGGNDG